MVYSFSGGSDEVFNEYEKENLRVLLKYWTDKFL